MIPDGNCATTLAAFVLVRLSLFVKIQPLRSRSRFYGQIGELRPTVTFPLSFIPLNGQLHSKTSTWTIDSLLRGVGGILFNPTSTLTFRSNSIFQMVELSEHQRRSHRSLVTTATDVHMVLSPDLHGLTSLVLLPNGGFCSRSLMTVERRCHVFDTHLVHARGAWSRRFPSEP